MVTPGAARPEAGLVAPRRGAGTLPGPRSHWTVAAVLFAGLAVLHTWPLATSPAALSRHDNADAQLNAWIVAWVAHQLPRDPRHLFQANIFHPARDTLAFSEPLVAPALMAAPALWAGASPVLAHNLLLLAGLALSGLAAYGVAWRWTRDRAAALTAGSLFAFNTHTLTRTAHLQALHAYGLPLALLFADRLATRPGPHAAIGLAGCMTLLAYTSGYLFVFATIMVAIVLVVRIRHWSRSPGRVAAGFALAAAVAALLVLPLYLPYRRAALEQGMTRTLDTVREFSASLPGYLATPARVHRSWSARYLSNPVDAFFPGMTAAVLSCIALWRAVSARARRAEVLLLAAVGLAGVVLSLGPATPFYGVLFDLYPPIRGLRAAARFGVLFLLAIAFLAAFGLAGMRQALSGSRWARPAAIAAVLLVNAEALCAPFEYRRFDGISPVYRLLADEPGPVVLAETPFYPPQAAFENAEYVLNSTAHWRPLMNGYSGYTPASYRAVAWTFWYFPEERAIAAMRAAGVTHVTVHRRRFGHEAAAAVEALSRRPDVELMAIDARRDVRLYRLK